MASPEKIASLLPDTLPDDFNDWDSEASSASGRGDSGESEAWEAAHSISKSPKPPSQSTNRDAIMEALMERPQVSRSASSAPVLLKKQEGFDDWDGEELPATPPSNRREWEAWEAAHSYGKAAKPLAQSAEYNAVLKSLLERPNVSSSASSAPVPRKPQKLTSEVVDVSPSRASNTQDAGHTANEVPASPDSTNAAAVDEKSNAPEFAATLKREASETLFQLFRSKNIEVEGKRNTPRKKWMTVAAICACSILLLLILMIPLFHHGVKAAVTPTIQPPPGASETHLKMSMPKPSAGGPLTKVMPPATTGMQGTTDNQPANEDAGVNSTPAQARMMNDQLTAPIRISQDAKKQVAANAPPPVNLGAANAGGLGGNGTMVGVFNGHAQPAIQVAPSRPLAISSGVATGMLIQKTPPVYPPIAKAARVSGTVQLQATISKSGTIKDLHVLTGPVMLRQSAIDAVRDWRFKPYRLNNQPTEVETTINVIFSLGG